MQISFRFLRPIKTRRNRPISTREITVLERTRLIKRQIVVSAAEMVTSKTAVVPSQDFKVKVATIAITTSKLMEYLYMLKLTMSPRTC